MPLTATVSSVSVNFTRLAFATVSVNSYVELRSLLRYQSNTQDTWTTVADVSRITITINPPMSYSEISVLPF